ncbi:hypothetical protein [Tenuibacillus multivorans]|uniref:hypothetical protein n=1 Tax=Tenuibacillus multivorans TaxID=237069 RepID=UPI00115FB176|nr:hypothetical protein [Tenuibacillus multivorans]
MKTEIVRPNAAAIIEFDDGSKPKLSGYLWEDESHGSELSSKQNKITLPSEKGKHIIEIPAEWAKGEASYTFVVEVQ